MLAMICLLLAACSGGDTESETDSGETAVETDTNVETDTDTDTDIETDTDAETDTDVEPAHDVAFTPIADGGEHDFPAPRPPNGQACAAVFAQLVSNQTDFDALLSAKLPSVTLDLTVNWTTNAVIVAYQDCMDGRHSFSLRTLAAADGDLNAGYLLGESCFGIDVASREYAIVGIAASDSAPLVATSAPDPRNTCE